ncbi:MAG: Mur ligase family protein [Longimicrobiales bacterium]
MGVTGARPLGSLLSEVSARVSAPATADRIVIRGISDDSRQVQPGYLFVAVPGARQDGRAFIADAVGRGAVAIVAPSATTAEVPVIEADNVRGAMAELAAIWYGSPAERLRLIGITGSVGKTSVLSMLSAILRHDGVAAGAIGSLGIEYGGHAESSVNTTAGPLVLQRALAGMVAAGVELAAMEVTSHALVQERVRGLRFDLGIFTNLVLLEHLDYHGSFAAYVGAKLRFFEHLRRAAPLVYSASDRVVDALARSRQVRRVPCGGGTPAEAVHIRRLEQSVHGSRVVLEILQPLPRIDGTGAPPTRLELRLRMLGRPNTMNAALAATAALCLGARHTSVIEALGSLEPPRRRMQVIHDAGPLVIDDTVGHPDSITAVFEVAAEFPHRALHVVFAVRGRRGPTINARDAEALAIWSRTVPIASLVITTGEDVADQRNRVAPEEHDAFVSELQREGVPFSYEPALRDAVAVAVERCDREDLLLLLGAQAMDAGAELALERLRRR